MHVIFLVPLLFFSWKILIHLILTTVSGVYSRHVLSNIDWIFRCSNIEDLMYCKVTWTLHQRPDVISDSDAVIVFKP